MPLREFKCLIVSDFNADLLRAFLQTDVRVAATIAPFGQVTPILLDQELDLWRQRYDFGVIWTQPHVVSPSFMSLMEYQRAPLDDVLQEVDDFAELILQVRKRFKHLFIPLWVLPSFNRGLGILDMRSGIGIANTVMQMNLRLADRLTSDQSIYLLNSWRWVAEVKPSAFSSKLWYMAKIPFVQEIFREAANDIHASLNALSGSTKKLIIVDLDDTLWGGGIGDEGIQNIQLGGHDPVGEAFVDFQKVLKAMTRRGVLLGIVSKNNEAVAMEAIRGHPEMVLRPDDFAGWRINWDDKAKNVAELVAELNLGLQSVVFIDDNPAERGRVAETLPEVLVPPWPEDKMLYAQTLRSLSCFDAPSYTDEDGLRAELYNAQRLRQNERTKVGSLEEWLKSLEVTVKIEELESNNFQRTLQLLNKTNQMNLSTRRLSEREPQEWTVQPGHHLWTVRVSDRFGDSGLTGVISMETHDNQAVIVDFVLSCRVFGRNVERVMVYKVCNYSQSLRVETIQARYLATAKNAPCLSFWKESGFACDEATSSFTWSLREPYPLPGHVKIVDSVEHKLSQK